MTEVKRSIDDFFDRGIERIVERRQEKPITPAGLQRLTPADPGSQSALAGLLNARDFDHDLREALHPVCFDRGLFLPGPYADALASANEHLQAEFRRTRSLHPRQALLLDRASRLLSQQLEWHGLARMYFYALLSA